MKLQTKIVLLILPLVLASILVLGFWTTQKLNESAHLSNSRYLNNVIDFYITEIVSRFHSILVQNDLVEINSFVSSYQSRAIKMAEEIAKKESGYIFALDEKGELVFSQNTLETKEIVKLFRPIAIRIAGGLKTDSTGHTRNLQEKSGFIYAVRYFKPWKWTIFFAISDEEIHAAERDIRIATIRIAAICSLALILLITFIFQKLIVNPINVIKKTAFAVTEGNHASIVEIKSKDELGDLARSMEKMSGEIQAHKKVQLNWQKTLEKKVEDRTTILQASLKEKETLLQEIHHRVKNNLNVVSSLLMLQAKGMDDDRLKEALKESQNRIYAMSAVHESLYSSENLAEIGLNSYVAKISGTLIQTYAANPGNVKLNVDADEIKIGIKQASPIGLIINELISNSLKYAFPNERTGKIDVIMKKIDNELELILMDNGIGIPDDFDWKNSKSLGLKLVKTLIENQLDGSIAMENNNGTKFTIKFNIEA